MGDIITQMDITHTHTKGGVQSCSTKLNIILGKTLMQIYQSFLINNLHSKLECTTLKMKKTSDEIIRQEDQTKVYLFPNFTQAEQGA